MNQYNNPKKSDWKSLVKRPYVDNSLIYETVIDVFKTVKENGDISLRELTKKFDKVELKNIKVEIDEIDVSEELISKELKFSIDLAFDNIYKFHLSQLTKNDNIEILEGINCWQEKRPISNVGFYIPGGTAPLFSTVLMLGIPSLIAKCPNRILCSPPSLSGNICPEILYACKKCGISKIYKVGGSQAIAAMTFGTNSIPKVDKIFGPGNQYVTEAKKYSMNFGISIDMPAGPSELLVLADESANPEYVAADLLSQAEHGIDSQVILVTNSEKLANDTLKEVQKQSKKLNRFKTIEKVLKNSKIILLDNEDELIKFSNFYGPEHLIICLKNKDLIDKIVNAGSVFIGNYSAESIGDYASGTNHTLPTNGYARQYSGVNLDSFLKSITYQEISEKGILNIGPIVEILSNAEGLEAHKEAVSIRLKYIKNKG